MHYKPTDSHNYLLHSSSHSQQVKYAIPFSQFLRLKRLCSNDSDFNNKCEEMFRCHQRQTSCPRNRSRYRTTIIKVTERRNQQNSIDPHLPATKPCSQKCNSQKLPKIFLKDPETKHIFSLPPLISFKRDKSMATFQLGALSSQTTNKELSNVHSHDAKLVPGPNRSAKITDHSTCISANVIYCITCTLCKKIFIGETGRRLADRFREHLRDVAKNDTDASKPVARHFNLPNHSHHNMTICGLSSHHGNTKSRKNLEQKFIFQLGTLYPRGINECFSFY